MSKIAYYFKTKIIMISKIEKESLTINKAIHQFLFHCQYEKQLDAKTIKSYETDLNQFESFIKKKNISNDNLTEIDKDFLKDYIKHISNFKPKTIKRKIASLKAMFNFIEFDNEHFANPFHKVKIKIKDPLILPTVMNINDVILFFSTLYKELEENNLTEYKQHIIIKNIAIIELLFSTGIRVSELCNLKCNDIDLTNGNIKVLGKGKKERVIQICQEEVLEALKSYYTLFKPTSFFFVNRLNNPISPQSVRLLIKKYKKLTGIDKNITPHTFRHTFATLLLEEDVDIKYIQSLLGHSSIATTQIYTHVSTQKQKIILSTKHPRLKMNFK